MIPNTRPRRQPSRALAKLLLVVATALVAGRASAQKAPAGAAGAPTADPAVESLYTGRLRLDRGERTSFFSLRGVEARQRTGNVIVLQGSTEGEYAFVTILPEPPLADPGTATLRADNPGFSASGQPGFLQLAFYLNSQTQGAGFRLTDGGPITIESIRAYPAGHPDLAAFAPQPQAPQPGWSSALAPVPSGGAAPGAYPGGGYPGSTYPGAGYPGAGSPGAPYPGGYVDPAAAASAVRPVPVPGAPGEPYREPYPGAGYPGGDYPGAGYPGGGYPAPQPYPQPYPSVEPYPVAPRPVPVEPSSWVDLYRGEMKVKQDDFSRQFPIPDGRRVKKVRVEWNDKDHTATGYLVINNDRSSRYRGIEVESPGVGLWSLDAPVDSFRIQARGDHIFITQVSVLFDNFYGDSPVVRPPVGGGHGGPHGGDQGDIAVFEGPFYVRENKYSDPFYLDDSRSIDRVVVFWDDSRNKAFGHVIFDNEPWNARAGADVGSPSTETFQANGVRAHRLRVYARRDDIRVNHIKVYYSPRAGRH